MVTCQASVEIVHAINSGGPNYTDTNGITYSADQTPKEGTMVWPYPFGGIQGPDAALYDACRYSMNESGLTYQLRVDGDGWYGLVVLSSVYTGQVGQYLYNVTLNGNAVILPLYDPFARCGLFKICNEIVYFHICDGMMYWRGQGGDEWTSSKVVNSTVSLYFDKYGYVDAVLLAKGNAGDTQVVIKDKTILFFDPVDERKCDFKEF
jgi:Malectin domain